MKKIAIKSLTLSELEALIVSFGEAKFRAKQVWHWIFKKGIFSFDEMRNVPASLRNRLNEVATVETLVLAKSQTSPTDQTTKCLFRLTSGKHIETVLIPGFDEEGDPQRLTVCVSSQVGCAMGCTFCATGTMGFQQNLHVGEIYDQVWLMNELAIDKFGRRITNIVFMGMGEPLQNYDNVLRAIDLMTGEDGLGLAARRITVSTVGLASRIKKLADDESRFNLAISLHAPTSEKRSSIMPVNHSVKTDLSALEEAVQYYYQKTKRHITYEYCIFDGFNDSTDDAKALAKITRWSPSKVNIIMYNPVEGKDFAATREFRLNAFIKTLVNQQVTVTVRRSRGQDIDAACGQLAVQEAQNAQESVPKI
jgi:23S rRNA (adenine2503-C2)-methyltransferase